MLLQILLYVPLKKFPAPAACLSMTQRMESQLLPAVCIEYCCVHERQDCTDQRQVHARAWLYCRSTSQRSDAPVLVVCSIFGPCRRITTSQCCTGGVRLQILWKGLLGHTCRQRNIPSTPRMIVSAAQWSPANLSLSWGIWRWLPELPLLCIYTAGRLAARLTAQIESALRLKGSHASPEYWCRLMLSACSNKQYTRLMEQ